MKIIIISEWFSEKMGYAENLLPIAFANLGHEVHLVTTDLQVYGTNIELYNSIYEKHLGPRITNQGVYYINNITVHRNPHSLENGLHVSGLAQKLREIKPDVVYCFEIMTRDYFNVVKYQKEFKYKIFCESRLHLSIYSPPKTLKQWVRQSIIILKSRQLAKKISRFYPIAPDVLKVITKYFGIPSHKCSLSSLAVDTNLFKPNNNKIQRELFRERLGYNEKDIVCIYTGRLNEDKGPLILAKAIDHLYQSGHTQFKGLFVGNGNKRYEEAILLNKQCLVHPFVQPSELPEFYNFMDIGIWPLQESTSQLDAMACGLPIIVNELVEDSLRHEGNGLTYKNNEFKDLAEKILMLKDYVTRQKMGKLGYQKITTNYSWEKLANDKLIDFTKYL